MSILVQRSAGNLSSLISGNEFYETVYESNCFPCNYNELQISLVTPLYIAFTPTKAGNFLGVILGLRCSYSGNSSATVRIRLQENTGSWVTRLTYTAGTDDWIPDPDYPLFSGLIDCRFASTYAITTASNTWRLAIDLTAGDPVFYLANSQNGTSGDVLFFIPYIDSQVTFSSSDTLVLTDMITMDQDWTITYKDATNGTQAGRTTRSTQYSIWTCARRIKLGDTTEPQIYVPSTVAADYELELLGNWFVCSQCTYYKIGEDTSNRLPIGRKFTLNFSNNSATAQHQILSETGQTYPGYIRGKETLCELYGEVPSVVAAKITQNVASGQPDVVIEGNVTSIWSVGDKIGVGGSQYTTTNTFRDPQFNEYMEIQSMSFSAGETTITCTGNFAYNHYIITNIDMYVVHIDRPIILKNNLSTVYSNRSWHFVCGGHFKWYGVEVYGPLYAVNSAFIETENYSTSEFATQDSVFDGCTFVTTRVPYRFLNVDSGVEISNECSVHESSAEPYSYHLSASDCRSFDIHDSYFVENASGAGFWFTNCMNINMYNNNINNGSSYAVRLTDSQNVHIYNNHFLRCVAGVLFDGCVKILCEDNVFRRCYYYTLYGADTEFINGCYYALTGTFNSDIKCYRDDADDSFAFYTAEGNSYVNAIFYDSDLGTVWTDDIVHEASVNFRANWIDGSWVRFHNLRNIAGHCRGYYAKGYLESSGAGLPYTKVHTAGGLAWSIKPYFNDDPFVLDAWKMPVGEIGKQVTVSIFVALHSTNYAAGTYQPPKFRMYGLGVTGVSIEAEAAVNTTDWQVLTISGEPLETGDLFIEFVAETDAVGDDALVYWDDAYLSYRSALDLGSLDLISDGIFIQPPLTVNITAEAIWSELVADNTISGSFGERLGQLIATLAELNSAHGSGSWEGATPAEIDAELTTAHGSGTWAGATTGDIDTVLTATHGSGSWQMGASTSELNAVETAIRGSDGDTLKTLSDQVDIVDANMIIAKGLIGDNHVEDNEVWNGDKNLTSCRIRVYDSKANALAAGATGLLHTFNMVATYGVDGLLDSYTLTRDGS